MADGDPALARRAGPIPIGPNGSFLFLGPTGVGKTRGCAKSLANFLFDTEEAMIRNRHVGVHGKARRGPPDWRATGLCRL